jgi:hypothetical protein
MYLFAGSDTEEEAASIHDSSEDSDSSIEKVSISKARKAQPALKRAKTGTKVTRAKQTKPARNCGGETTFTVDSIMLAFTDKTEYGISFRAMNSEQQKIEVDTYVEQRRSFRHERGNQKE